MQQLPNAPPRMPRARAANASGSNLSPMQHPSNAAPQAPSPVAHAAKRPENDLDIDVDDFAMESLDRKGKGRTLSNNSSSRPSFAMQGPPSSWAFEERANVSGGERLGSECSLLILTSRRDTLGSSKGRLTPVRLAPSSCRTYYGVWGYV